ncbi:MAG: DUF5011 domain-containing protein [Gammaproteobacteria bacterium]|nr:DUF5011 domain-containing protein [Gammaproteobacteria bacterium]
MWSLRSRKAILLLAFCLLHLLGFTQSAHAFDPQTTCRVTLFYDTNFSNPSLPNNHTGDGTLPPYTKLIGRDQIAEPVFENTTAEGPNLDVYQMYVPDMFDDGWDGYAGEVSSILFEHIENGVYVPGCDSWTAMLNDGLDYEGDNWVAITGSLSHLSDIGWNDRAASFRLIGPAFPYAGSPPSGCTVELYEHGLSGGDTWGASSRVTPHTFSANHGAGKISTIRFGGECGTTTVSLSDGSNSIGFSNADGPEHYLAEYNWNDRATSWKADFDVAPDPSSRGCILRMFGDGGYSGPSWAVAASQTRGTINDNRGSEKISSVAFEGDCGNSEVIFYDGHDQTGEEAYVRVADEMLHPLWLSDWNDKPRSWTANFVSGSPVPTASNLPVPVYAPCEVRLYDGIYSGTAWSADINQAIKGVYSSSDGAGLVSSVEFRGALCKDAFLHLYDVDPSEDANAVPYVIKVADSKRRDLSTLGFSNRTQYWSVHFSNASPTPSRVPNVVDMHYTDGERALSRMFYRPVADQDYLVRHRESRIPDGKILWTSDPGGRDLPAGTPLAPGSAVHYTKYAHPAGPPPPAPPPPPPGPVVTFDKFSGKALDIGADNGEIWVIGTDNNLYRSFLKGWQKKGGQGALMRVESGDIGIWTIDKAGVIIPFINNRGGWQPPVIGVIPAQDIGSGGGENWIAGRNPPYDIQRIDSYYQKWVWDDPIAVPGGVWRIDVDKNGNPWVVNQNGQIYRHLPGGWQLLPGSATDIGCGLNGDVWIAGTTKVHGGYEMLRWNEGSFGWDLIPEIGGVAVTVTAMTRGQPWVAADDGTIYWGTLNKDSPVVPLPASHPLVPDVTGKTTTAAVLAIENAGYVASNSGSVFTTDADLIDTIDSLTPATGVPLAPGNTVSFIYRKGLTYVLNGSSSVSLHVGDAYVDEGLSVIVEPDRDTIDTIYGNTDEVDVSTPGTYNVDYQVILADESKYTAATRTVHVVRRLPTLDPAQAYNITSIYSGKCLDVKGGSTVDGANVHQWDCIGMPNEAWKFVRIGGNFVIRALHSGKYLGVEAVSQEQGANIQQSSGPDGENQQWTIVPDGWNLQIRAAHSGKCLDVFGYSQENGGNVLQWDCSGADNQLWSIQVNNPFPDPKSIKAFHSGKCLDVHAFSQENGGNVTQWDCNELSNQKWNITPDGSHFKISPTHSGKCLDVFGYSQENGGNVLQWDCSGADNQLWDLVPDGSNYKIKSFHSGKCLDVAGISQANGGNLHQWDCVDVPNQKWSIE